VRGEALRAVGGVDRLVGTVLAVCRWSLDAMRSESDGKEEEKERRVERSFGDRMRR
jgi:hypothetical protein